MTKPNTKSNKNKLIISKHHKSPKVKNKITMDLKFSHIQNIFFLILKKSLRECYNAVSYLSLGNKPSQATTRIFCQTTTIFWWNSKKTSKSIRLERSSENENAFSVFSWRILPPPFEFFLICYPLSPGKKRELYIIKIGFQIRGERPQETQGPQKFSPKFCIISPKTRIFPNDSLNWTDRNSVEGSDL